MLATRPRKARTVTELVTGLRYAIDSLERINVKFALVGGLAVGAHAEPRFTADIDLAVSVASDAETEQIVRSLISTGFCILAQIESRHSRRLRGVRLQMPGHENGPVLDLLFSTSGIEPEVVANAQLLEVFTGCRVPVAQPADLVAMKILSDENGKRKSDRRDLHWLMTILSEADIETVRSRLDLIVSRGWNRDRDLQSEFTALVAETGWPDCQPESEF